MAKYKNIRVEDEDGNPFPSKLERSVSNLLKLREKAGEIKIERQQARIHLTDAELLYIADFECFNTKTGEVFYVEAKGLETAVWRIKRNLYRFYGPAPLEIWKGSHGNPKLFETIIPKRLGA